MIKLRLQKEQLIERLGVHFECRDQLAPLAARIVATLILTGKRGATFEELVADLSASKSTISTHLNNLQNAGRITYFTKPGDRKKYFVMSSDSLVRYLDKMMDNWQREKNLHVEMMHYKKEINKSTDTTDDIKFDLGFHTRYMNFLEQAISSMEDIRKHHTN